MQLPTSLQLKLLQVLARELHSFINLVRLGTVSYTCRAFAASLAADRDRYGTCPFTRHSALFAVLLCCLLVQRIVIKHRGASELTSETAQP